MVSPIEVAHIGEKERIVDLAGKTGANEEPGFQVEGLNTIDDMFVLELLLYRGAPHMMPGGAFYDVFKTTVDDRVGNAEAVTIPPHLDYDLSGFAAHHNLHATYPVQLAVCRNANTFRPGLGHRMYRSHIVEGTQRDGITMPGRITVSSEGYAPTSTKKTLHFYDRRKTDGIVRVNRYENSDPFTLERRYVAVSAMQAALESLRAA